MHGRAQPLLDSPPLVRYGLPSFERGVSPAAGAHFTQEITGQFHTRLLTVSCRLVTSATVASRQVVVEYRDDGDVRVALAGPATSSPASQTNDYFFSAFLGTDVFTVDSTALAPLPPLLLPPTYDFRIYVANIQAADQLSNIRFTWERFYTTNEPALVSPHSGT
jgi:hypothetical protein